MKTDMHIVHLPDKNQPRVTSCGILLHHDGKFFVGHCTNKPDVNGWTIPKGRKEPGETDVATAYREFKEETNIDLKALGLGIKQFTAYKMKHKDVVVFFCNDEDGVTTKIQPVCKSLVEPTDFSPGGFPEIDDFRWVTRSEAERLVFPSQKFMFRS